jgi:twitching motility protein PilI
MERKISLSEFQASVAAKLKNRASGDAASPSKLGVQVGAQFWLVNLSDISEALPVPKLTSVPLAQPWFCGVANFRGNLQGIVDFPQFLGGAPTPFSLDCRLLLIHQKFAVNCGIVVSRMLGLRNPGKMQRMEIDGEAPPWVAAEYQDETGQRWRELNMPMLTGHDRFLNVALP